MSLTSFPHSGHFIKAISTASFEHMFKLYHGK
nr:MAG TPA_asm: hypothetical protein [Caudoviricetes sp.]